MQQHLPCLQHFEKARPAAIVVLTRQLKKQFQNNKNLKMKKNILSIVLAVSILLTGTVSNAAATNSTDKKLTPQEKVMKDFNAQFTVTPTITILDNGFMASSVVDGRKVNATYNKKGNRVYSIVRYTTADLDKNIVDVVKYDYNEYFITSMEKIQQPGFDDVYLVHLVNPTSIKTVRVNGDETELIQDLKKI